MDFPRQINSKRLRLSIIHFKGSQVELSKIYILLLSLRIVFKLENSAGPDEMLHSVSFHLGLYCFSKCPFSVRLADSV